MADLAEQRALARAQVPLAKIVSETVDLRPDRSELRGSCPFHPDIDRGLYLSRRNHFHCFSCGASGDVVDWAMHVYQVDETDAISRLLRYPPQTDDKGPALD